MTGAELLGQVMYALTLAGGPNVDDEFPFTAESARQVAHDLAGCVLLTREEAELVRIFVDWILTSGMPDWDDVEAREREVLALLEPKP